MGGRLPKEPYKVRELWRIQVELVEILVMGIMIINTWCSVLSHLWQVRWLPPAAYSDESYIKSLDKSEPKEADDKTQNMNQTRPC